jgi:hypothetical protein
VDGKAQFNLTLFRGLEPRRSGGSVLIGIGIAVEQSALAQARRRLSSIPPTAVFAPLPYLQSKVWLTVPGLPTMTAPIVAGQSQVVFARSLPPEAASVVRRSITEDPRQCGVVFDLVYLGSRPDPAWLIQADWTEVERRLAEKTAETLEEVQALVDDLVQGGAAGLNFDPAWGEPGAVESEEAAAWLAEFVTATFLEPRFAPDGGSSPRFILRERGQSPDDAQANATIVERHVYGQASLREMLASTGEPAESFVHLVDLDDLHPAPFSVQILCPALGHDVEMVNVDLDYGSGGRRSVTLHSSDQRGQVFWPFDPEAGRSYRYSYHGTYSGSGARFESTKTVGDSAILIIAPSR